MSSDELIGASEAGRLLGVSRDTVLRRAAAGDVPSAGKLAGPNGPFLFRRSDIEALVVATAKAAS